MKDIFIYRLDNVYVTAGLMLGMKLVWVAVCVVVVNRNTYLKRVFTSK